MIMMIASSWAGDSTLAGFSAQSAGPFRSFLHLGLLPVPSCSLLKVATNSSPEKTKFIRGNVTMKQVEELEVKKTPPRPRLE